jgi:hypothetical protein
LDLEGRIHLLEKSYFDIFSVAKWYLKVVVEREYQLGWIFTLDLPLEDGMILGRRRREKSTNWGGSAPWIYLWKMVDVLGGGGGKQGPTGENLHPADLSRGDGMSNR